MENNVRKLYWIKRDSTAAYVFHKFFLGLFLLMRVTVFAWLFTSRPVIFQLIGAILLEWWAARWRIGDYISYDFNVWHRRDVWATFIQIFVFVFALIARTVSLKSSDIASVLLLHLIEIYIPEKLSFLRAPMKILNTMTYLALLSLNGVKHVQV